VFSAWTGRQSVEQTEGWIVGALSIDQKGNWLWVLMERTDRQSIKLSTDGSWVLSADRQTIKQTDRGCSCLAF
jgi:hypothetical protein